MKIYVLHVLMHKTWQHYNASASRQEETFHIWFDLRDQKINPNLIKMTRVQIALRLQCALIVVITLPPQCENIFPINQPYIIRSSKQSIQQTLSFNSFSTELWLVTSHVSQMMWAEVFRVDFTQRLSCVSWEGRRNAQILMRVCRICDFRVNDASLAAV